MRSVPLLARSCTNRCTGSPNRVNRTEAVNGVDTPKAVLWSSSDSGMGLCIELCRCHAALDSLVLDSFDTDICAPVQVGVFGSVVIQDDPLGWGLLALLGLCSVTLIGIFAHAFGTNTMKHDKNNLKAIGWHKYRPTSNPQNQQVMQQVRLTRDPRSHNYESALGICVPTFRSA